MMAQRGEGGELPSALLWLGMRPALATLYRKAAGQFEGDPAALMSVLTSAFTELVATIDLRRVKRVAATLARSTKRAVLNEIQQDEKERSRTEPRYLWEPGKEPVDALVDVAIALRGLRRRLHRAVGTDGDLLIATILIGEPRQEVADRLGIQFEAVKKRLHRVRTRARLRLADGDAEAPGNAGRRRRSQLKRPARSTRPGR